MGIAVVMPPGSRPTTCWPRPRASPPTAGARTVIMTSDRDAFSLIDDNTRVLRIINGGVEASPLLTPERLELMLGIRPRSTATTPRCAAMRPTTCPA